MKRTIELAHILSCVILVLAVVASGCGLFTPAIYRDSDTIKRAWFGSDVTTLFIVVPIFIIVLRSSMRGSLRARLIWVGLLGYMFYNFAFYLFGATFNSLFLVYTALFTLSIYTLILSLSTLPVRTIGAQFNIQTPVRSLCVFMIIIALPLAIFELSQVFMAIISGNSPAVPPLIFALDLSFVIPNMLLASILLWKRYGWGYVLTAMMMVKGFTYGIGLLISTASVAEFSLSGNWDELMPFYVLIATGSLIASILLLKNLHAKNNYEAVDSKA